MPGTVTLRVKLQTDYHGDYIRNAINTRYRDVGVVGWFNVTEARLLNPDYVQVTFEREASPILEGQLGDLMYRKGVSMECALRHLYINELLSHTQSGVIQSIATAIGDHTNCEADFPEGFKPAIPVEGPDPEVSEARRLADKFAGAKYTIVKGNLNDGFTLHGVFDDGIEASAHAEKHNYDHWDILPIHFEV